jgi:UDPglucose 6-dehydrogenase
LAKTADERGVSLDVIRAVQDANERQKGVLFRKLQSVIGDALTNKTIAVWGLAFKAQTDDMRESPSIQLIKSLLRAGASVRAHDPKAAETARRMFGDQVGFFGNAYETLAGADALVIVTEWMQFRNPDFERMKSLLKQAIIVDGRNLYDPARMSERGFTYACIGRRTVP